MRLAMVCRRNPSLVFYCSPLTAHRSPLTVFRLQVGSWQKAVGNGLLSEPVLNAKAQRRKIASC